MGKLERNLPNDAYEAATNANNPSASNPFITEVESAVGSASLLLYPTSAASAIPTYSKLVNTISDPDYDDPAVDSSTGVINATGQLIAEFASEEGVISGNPGVVNVNTIGNIRRVSGTGTATFYFEVYIRDNGGAETLIGTSNTTGASSNAVYEQYFASCLINATSFGPTDRVVTKWYANRLPGGSDPTYEIQLGGATPVKITFPVPFVNLPSTVEELNDLTDVTTGLPGSPTNADDGRVLYYDVDTNQWISDDIANISNVVKDCKTSVGTGSIPKGTPVYLTGYDNDLLVVEPCDAASSATMPCIGITAEALDSTNAKKVVSFGKIQGFDTSLWADGTELYVAVGGGFTTTRPTGTAEIQRVAVVLKGLSAAGGSIKVFNTSRTAGLPNLPQDNIWVGDANGHPQAEPLCPSILTDLLGTDTVAVCRWNGSSFDRFAITGQSLLDLQEVSGSGTLNYIPKWTPDGTTLGDSPLQVGGAGFNIGHGGNPLGTTMYYINSAPLVGVAGLQTGIDTRMTIPTAITNRGIKADSNNAITRNTGFEAIVGTGAATPVNVGADFAAGSAGSCPIPTNDNDAVGFRVIGMLTDADGNNLGPALGAYLCNIQSNAFDNVGLMVDVANAGAGGAYIGLLKDGNEGAGKVLTSDANGYASWQTPGGGGGSGVNWIPMFSGALFATNQTFYSNWEEISGTQSFVETPFPAGTLNAFKINCDANNANNPTVIDVMRGASVLISVTIPGLTTGIFEATGSVAIANNDLLSIRVTIPAGGPSIGLRGGLLSITV